MIKTFADKRTEALYISGAAKRVPPDLATWAARTVEYVYLATTLNDLHPPR